MDADAGAVAPGRGAGRALHIPGCLIVGQRARLESWAVRCLGRDSIHPKRAPVVPINVPGKQVPATAPYDKPLRIGSAPRVPAVVADVIEAQSLAGADCASDCAQYLRIYGWPGSGNADRRGPHGVDSMP